MTDGTSRSSSRAPRTSAVRIGVGALGLVLAVVALLGAGCGQQPGDRSAAAAASSPAAGPPVLDAEGVATLVRLEESLLPVYLRHFATVADLVAWKPDVLTGTVDAVLPGRSTVTTAEKDDRATRESTVLIRVKVDREIKVRTAGAVTDGYAYLSFLRAVNDIDENGEVIGLDTYPSVEELQRAIPVGTRIVVASGPEPRELVSAQRVEAEPHPLPPGATVLGGFGQGVIYDQGPGQRLTASIFPALTFDEVVARLG
jgi:hypothetical protein